MMTLSLSTCMLFLGRVCPSIHTTLPGRPVAGARVVGCGPVADSITGTQRVRWRLCRPHRAGITMGAPLFFNRTTMNFAASVWLALRETVCISSGPS